MIHARLPAPVLSRRVTGGPTVASNMLGFLGRYRPSSSTVSGRIHAHLYPDDAGAPPYRKASSKFDKVLQEVWGQYRPTPDVGACISRTMLYAHARNPFGKVAATACPKSARSYPAGVDESGRASTSSCRPRRIMSAVT